MKTINPAKLKERSRLLLMQALSLLENEAARLGYAEVGYFIGVARESLIEKLEWRSGEQLQ
jgi:hypothetical protein